VGHGADAQLIVLGTGKRVYCTSRVPAEVRPLGRGRRDRGEETPTGEDRAEGMESRCAITPHSCEVADREAMRVDRGRPTAVERDDPRP
jgi:hypothetical protein